MTERNRIVLKVVPWIRRSLASYVSSRSELFRHWLIIIGMFILSVCPVRGQSPAVVAPATVTSPKTLWGTAPLTQTGDLATAMQQDVDQFLTRITHEASSLSWQDVDFSSRVAYRGSIEGRRQRFERICGVVDQRVAFDDLEIVRRLNEPDYVLETQDVRALAVRWPVLEGITAEGLLLEPREKPQAMVIALPDADWTPEMLAGLEAGPVPTANYAMRLCQSGCRVLIPTLISRGDTWSGNPEIRMLNQPHREFIYRPAYYLGRHMIGFEIQKVLAAVDYFAHSGLPGQSEESSNNSPAIGVAGYGEGALIAFYSAAVDERIDAALVSGYFQDRSEVWREPVYRNVWGLLRDFGDAKIASLIAPRKLTIEACRGVELDGPPPARPGARNYAATGALVTAPITSVRAEFDLAKRNYESLGVPHHCRLIESDDGNGPPCSPAALQHFLSALGIEAGLAAAPAPSSGASVRDQTVSGRMERQVGELVSFNQRRFWESSRRRASYWQSADSSSLETWESSTRAHRQYLLEHVIGDWPLVETPHNPRTRLIYETKTWKGYELVLDVAPGIWLYGILLLPGEVDPSRAGAGGIGSLEQRPVVVCVHGRGGQPQQVCDPHSDHRAYHRFGAKLADRGFVVFAPQHLYFGEEKYRRIQRKANPLGLSLFSPMIWQHRKLLRWLAEQPYVDADRIAFYGLSYGGKSALVIPAVLEGYAASICSGAFSDTVRKHIDAVGGNGSVFLFTNEYEHLEFDFAEKFNHAELAWLISPRPFMVEKGHWDGGLPDQWTAFEYARVRRQYVRLGIGDRTEMELFPGGHEINELGTFDFLQRQLEFKR